MMRKSVFDIFSHLLKSSLRGANRGQANFELGNKKLIGSSLDDCDRNRGLISLI